MASGGVNNPVVSIMTPVGLRGDVQATRHPEGVWSVVGGPGEFAGQRRLSVVAVSPGGHISRAAMIGQGGIETLWSRRRGRTGASSGPGEGGGGGRGRRGPTRSPGQSAVTQRDAVEALT